MHVMYVKPVVLTAFVSPEVRQKIKILAASTGMTVRELLTRELQLVIDRAESLPSKKTLDETD